MTPIQTLLVPLDGSSKALAALPVARGLAHVMGATVTLLHVGREPLSLRQLVDRIKLPSKDVRGLRLVQVTGAPAEVIVQTATARHAVFIVMSVPARLDGTYPVGSVPGDVLRKAPCPVVLVPSCRGRRLWTLRQVVLPHDGTPTSAAVIAPTAHLATRAGAGLVVIHVATPSARPPTEPGTFAAPRYVDQPHHEFPTWAREFLARVRGACHSTRIEKIRLVMTQGEIGEAILEFAHCNSSDMIALAWRGRFGPECARTLRRVIRGAHCPVIVLRVQS